jgi:hypothetical protein
LNKKDIKRGVITLPEDMPSYIDMFELLKKDIHIVEKKGSFERFLIVKCMESFIGGIGGDKNIIRTLRIINPDNNFEVMDQIILEQIPAYTYNEKLQRKHTSIL